MDVARDIGFNSGIASPCVFKHKTRRLWLTVHGDGFTLLGSGEDLDWFEKEIKAKFEVKVRGRLGPGPDDLKSIRILNRIVEWTQDGLWYEADQRHAEIFVKDLGLDQHKVRCEVPGEKLTYEEEDEELLPEHEVKKASSPCGSCQLPCTGSLRHPVLSKGACNNHVITYSWLVEGFI